MRFSFSSGNYEIISHGQTFLFPDCDLKINVNVDDEYSFRVIMNFSEDSAEADFTIKTNVYDDTIVLDCVNFVDTGTGLFEPQELAIVRDRKLYFCIWSFMYGTQQSKIRSVVYTFFYEKAAGDK